MHTRQRYTLEIDRTLTQTVLETDFAERSSNFIQDTRIQACPRRVVLCNTISRAFNEKRRQPGFRTRSGFLQLWLDSVPNDDQFPRQHRDRESRFKIVRDRGPRSPTRGNESRLETRGTSLTRYYATARFGPDRRPRVRLVIRAESVKRSGNARIRRFSFRWTSGETMGDSTERRGFSATLSKRPISFVAVCMCVIDGKYIVYLTYCTFFATTGERRSVNKSKIVPFLFWFLRYKSQRSFLSGRSLNRKS